MAKERWHQGSRFWMLAPYGLLLSVALSMYFDDPSPWNYVAPIIFGGGGAQTTMRYFKRTRPTEEDLP